MKTEFSFKALNIAVRQNCLSPVAASVRKSESKWINIRLNKATVKTTTFKPGVIVSIFIDESNRALLFLSDQRPTPPGSRKVYGKDTSSLIDIPRREILAEWFHVGPMRPLTLIEASHGRLVVQVPK